MFQASWASQPPERGTPPCQRGDQATHRAHTHKSPEYGHSPDLCLTSSETPSSPGSPGRWLVAGWAQKTTPFRDNRQQPRRHHHLKPTLSKAGSSPRGLVTKVDGMRPQGAGNTDTKIPKSTWLRGTTPDLEWTCCHQACGRIWTHKPMRAE